MGGGWWILMGIGMVLVWVLIILVIVWLVRSLITGRPAVTAGPSGGETTPLEILDRRLAEGSISLEEYDERRRVLSGSTGQRESER